MQARMTLDLARRTLAAGHRISCGLPQTTAMAGPPATPVPGHRGAILCRDGGVRSWIRSPEFRNCKISLSLTDEFSDMALIGRVRSADTVGWTS
jgi:hypothetical protein